MPPRRAKRHRRKESGIDETGRRSDPKNEKSGPTLRTPGTGVEATPEKWRREAPPDGLVKMSTFLADMIQKGYTEDEVFGVLFESERERKRRQMLTRVTKTVDDHRLKQMR